MLAPAQRLQFILSKPQALLQTAATAVNVLLVILLAHTLARFAWSILVPQAPVALQTHEGVNVRETTITPGLPAGVEYAVIAGWHLFGQANAVQPVESPAPGVAAAAPLSLRLAGIFFIEQGGSRALALIAEGGNLEHSYRVGDLLPGGSRLELIQRDHVVISHDGRQEQLYLPKSTGTEGEAGSPGSGAPPITPEGEPEEEPTTFREPQVIDASAVAERLRSKVIKRPQALEGFAFVSPAVQNGQCVGFRLRPGPDRQRLTFFLGG